MQQQKNAPHCPWQLWVKAVLSVFLGRAIRFVALWVRPVFLVLFFTLTPSLASAQVFTPQLPTTACKVNIYGWSAGNSVAGDNNKTLYTGKWSYNATKGYPEITGTPGHTSLGVDAGVKPAEFSGGGNDEYWLYVTRLEGPPGSQHTVTVFDKVALEHLVIAVLDADGTALTTEPNPANTSNKFVSKTYYLNFTFPASGIAYAHIFIADYEQKYGQVWVDDCSVNANYDFGDAPDSYSTLKSSNGPRHVLSNHYLGSARDSETDATLSSGDASDDANDDGVTFSSLTQGQSATITVNLTRTGLFLQGWIDWNGDGDFDDADEQIAQDVKDTNNDKVITLNPTVPVDAATGQTFARFRVAREAGIDYYGAAITGEVEDYAVTIQQRSSGPIGSARCTGTDLVTNGGFESPVRSSGAGFYTSVPNWTTTDSAIEIWKNSNANVASHTGTQFIEANANAHASLTNGPISVNGRAELTVYWAHMGRNGTDSLTVNLRQGSGAPTQIAASSADNSGWKEGTATHVLADDTSQAHVIITTTATSDNSVNQGSLFDSLEVCQTYVTLTKAEGDHTDVDADGKDSAGDKIAYSYTISNPSGNEKSLSSVEIIDDKIGTITTGPTSGDTDSDGELDPGESWVIDAEYTIVQSDMDGGTLTNIAFARGNTGDNIIRSDNAEVSVALAAAPGLSITKTAQLVKASDNSGTNAEAGDTINYDYVVTNTGNITVSNVEISDEHEGSGSFPDPTHDTLTDNGPSGDSSDTNADDTIWGSLAPGDAVSFKATYTLTQSDFDNQGN